MNKLSILVALVALVGCQKKEEASPTSTETPAQTATTTPAAAATAPAEPQVNLETLPTEEDFEEEADKEITSQNLEQKLDEIEKEIAAE